MRILWLRRLWLGLALLLDMGAACALAPADALALATGDGDARIAAINRLAVDPDERTLALLQALGNGAVKVQSEQVLLIADDGSAKDAVTGASVTLAEDAEDSIVNNRLRGALEAALSVRDLFGSDVAAQQAAAVMLQKSAFDEPNAQQLPMVEKALANTALDAQARRSLELARAAMQLASEDEALRLGAARALADRGDPALKPLLAARMEAEGSASVKAALSSAISALDRSLAVSNGLSQAFTGLSLGSILLLAALGLAITYGLMGVINMAHGELIMIGAYATWLVQGFFKDALPGLFDWYLLAAMPVAFLASALVGAAMERSVIRFLYGRPLETLLATWGISLVLMQGVRSLFGAQNVGVENPSWMSGSVTLLGNLTLPWNRIYIIVFALAVLLSVSLLISRTRLGLFVRGVTQNRPIASCMGVNTARIDTYAFALGSGIAGLAGCALSQIGNVGPDLGQNYIVDSFMVVVLGGVGQLAGTVYAALGLGLFNKFLEGWAGAVLAKIAVLVLIIVFIQKRPQGIFAFKGREA